MCLSADSTRRGKNPQFICCANSLEKAFSWPFFIYFIYLFLYLVLFYFLYCIYLYYYNAIEIRKHAIVSRNVQAFAIILHVIFPPIVSNNAVHIDRFSKGHGGKVTLLWKRFCDVVPPQTHSSTIQFDNQTARKLRLDHCKAISVIYMMNPKTNKNKTPQYYKNVYMFINTHKTHPSHIG